MFTPLSAVIQKKITTHHLYKQVKHLTIVGIIQKKLTVIISHSVTVVAYKNTTLTLKTNNHLATHEISLRAEAIKTKLRASGIPVKKITCVA